MNIEVPSIVMEKDGTDIVNRPSRVASCMQEVLSLEDESDRHKEHFWIIGINQANGVMYIELVTLGIANASLVHPREVFRTAIIKNCISVIAVHNHPSGNLKISEEDKETTRGLRQAGEILKIELLDHVIISKNDYVSVREEEPILFA